MKRKTSNDIVVEVVERVLLMIFEEIKNGKLYLCHKPLYRVFTSPQRE